MYLGEGSGDRTTKFPVKSLQNARKCNLLFQKGSRTLRKCASAPNVVSLEIFKIVRPQPLKTFKFVRPPKLDIKLKERLGGQNLEHEYASGKSFAF